MQDVGYGASADITLRVDQRGYPHFLQIQGFTPQLANAATPACRQQIQALIAGWRYQPFERGGHALEVQIVERVLMLPAERWRVPRRQFPLVSNPDSVVITLQRFPGLFLCEGDRSASYELQIRGSSEVTIIERIRNSVTPGSLFVDGPVRRFRIDPNAVNRLVERFRIADFFSLESEYVSGITDQPSQMLTVQIGTDRASVTDDVGETVGMPMVVRDLEVAVDAAAGLAPLRCGPDDILRAN